MKTYEITIPTAKGPMTVEMSAKDVSDFHEKLTTFYNDNYEEIETQAITQI
jgi:hypothetical protein